jgi:hypothetical protein
MLVISGIEIREQEAIAGINRDVRSEKQRIRVRERPFLSCEAIIKGSCLCA